MSLDDMICSRCGFRIPIGITVMGKLATNEVRHIYDCLTPMGEAHTQALLEQEKDEKEKRASISIPQ